ncbi:MAG TPA: Lrp/AsnC family transcriptional regulator, partial [Candidatus Poseidoniales archaeon]|nr:Lrp/AsnC family transcriptional regulator [Candidatus Poseidoniales archaeon]
FGEFDLMAKVNTSDFYDLGQVVVQKIRTVEGVQDTQTHPATKL